jgi:CHAT domain-containing protein
MPGCLSRLEREVPVRIRRESVLSMGHRGWVCQFLRDSAGHVRLILAALVCLWFSAAPGSSMAQAFDPAPDSNPIRVALVPGQTITAEIPAQIKRTFTIAACAGCFVEVRIEQMRLSMPVATLSGPGIDDPLARSCDAGSHSILRIPFIAPQSAEYTLEIHLARPSSEAVEIKLALLRPAAPIDSDVAAAYDAMAGAESLRRAASADATQKAIAAFDRTLQLAQKTGDRELERQALIGKTRVYLYRLGDYSAGLKTAEEARVLMTKPRDNASQSDLVIDAATWKVLSSAYYFLARYSEMIDATNRSLELYVALDDLYWQGILRGNIASVYAETGDLQHALSSAEGALSIARQLSDADGISFSLATIASIHDSRGEYQSALDANQAALDEIGKHPYPDEEGQVWMALGELYDELNDLGPERDALTRALPLLRKAGDMASASTTLSDLSLLDMRQGHRHDAEQALEQAMAIARSHQLHREQAVAYLHQAILSSEEGRPETALKAVHDGLALASNAGEAATSALLLQEQGDLNSHLGNTNAALSAYRESDAKWTAIPNLEHAALARASIARLEFRSGQFDLAHDDIMLALEGFEASRRNIGSHSLRASHFASVRAFYDLAIDMDMRRSQTHSSVVEEAWQIAERARARSLMDEIRSSTAFSVHDIPQALVDQSAEIEHKIGAVQQEVFQLRVAGIDSPELHRAQDQLHALVLRAEEGETAERATIAPSLFGSAKRAPSLDDVRNALLPRDAALLEYWVGARGVWLWIVTADSLRGLRICDASTLDREVASFQRALLARENFPENEDYATRQERIAHADRTLNTQAFILGRLLLPVPLPSAVRRLVIVPDGILNSIPFSALRPLSAGYLVSKYELMVEPSASIAMALLNRPPLSASPDRIAVFADPVYNQFDPRLTEFRSAVPATTSGVRTVDPPVLRAETALDLSALPRLHASLTEAKAIAAIAGADRVNLWLGFQATAAQVMQVRWADFAIAHFAAHTIVDSEHPELSGIVLSTLDHERRREDGILWLHDIYRTPMPVSLVVLSGCRTASGESIPGEGISGLAQAFLSSGASAVLGTLWTINDHDAGEIVPEFYRTLLIEHLSIAGALRSAQLRMISLHRSPYDWAGYVAEGNWRTGSSHSDSVVLLRSPSGL